MNDYEALRPLLLDAGDPTITAAVERYDAAIVARRNAPPRKDRAGAAQQAFDAELRAAAVAGRTPTGDRRTISAARLADRDDDVMRDALDVEVKSRRAALDAAVAGGAARLLHVLAVEYSRLGGYGAPVPRHLETLWMAMLWPQLYEGPGEIVEHLGASWPSKAYAPVAWWPPSLPGAWPGRTGTEKVSWFAHVFAQLARPRRKGYAITDAGELRLRDRWRAPGREPIGRGQGSGRLVAGAVVWVGGADGVTPGDIGGQPWSAPAPAPVAAASFDDDDDQADDGADLAQLYADGVIDATEMNARIAARASAATTALLAQQRAARS
jgi:hypothetical protein